MKVLKFENAGCKPCQAVQEFLEREGVKFKAIDAFKEPREAAKHDIGSVPTVIVLDDQDNELKRSIGFKPAELEEIVEMLEGE
ncbi:putative thioredoxin [Bacillus phage BC-T25]|nr:putative thioredoxin [Bacillus phage BC-T25]